EMWSVFPNGERFFSRTLATQGTLAALHGESSWRRFELPFFLSGTTQTPSRLEINLVLPGRGTVWLGPLRLERPSAPAAEGGVAQSSGWQRSPGRGVATRRTSCAESQLWIRARGPNRRPYRAGGASRTSRTLVVSCPMVNGLARNAVAGSTISFWNTASWEYPDVRRIFVSGRAARRRRVQPQAGSTLPCSGHLVAHSFKVRPQAVSNRWLVVNDQNACDCTPPA